MVNYRVDTLALGAFTTESGETIENLKLQYEYVGYLTTTRRRMSCVDR